MGKPIGSAILGIDNYIQRANAKVVLPRLPNVLQDQQNVAEIAHMIIPRQLFSVRDASLLG
jgi:hypothetical protein